MARAGVVPSVGAFLRGALQLLEDRNLQIGLQLFQEDGQCRAHDSSADEYDVPRIFCNLVRAIHIVHSLFDFAGEMSKRKNCVPGRKSDAGKEPPQTPISPCSLGAAFVYCETQVTQSIRRQLNS